MSANTLFISPALLKSRTGISNTISDDIIIPVIKVAQDMYVQPALGSTLYKRLQTGITSDNLTNNEKSLIDDYITDTLVWFTMSQLPLTIGYQFFSKGVLQKTAEESNPPSRADLELLESRYKQMAEFYKQRLINYLRENYTLFTEYLNPGSGWDVIFPEKRAYTSPIYLGSHYDDPFTYAGGNNSTTTMAKDPVYHTPAAGVSSFSVPGLIGQTVIGAFRSGYVKGITTESTNNTLYLQITGNLVTLPTGDITGTDELFIFEIK